MHFYRYFPDTDTLFPDTVEKIQKMYLDTYLADTRYDTPILWCLAPTVLFLKMLQSRL